MADLTNGSKSKPSSKLGKEWKVFLSALVSPFVMVLIFATAALFYFQSYHLNPVVSELNNSSLDVIRQMSFRVQTLSSIITIIISVSSGLLGAVIFKRWSDFKEGGVLITRGKSAIRGLNLLSQNISRIERRVNHYLTEIDETQPEYKFLKICYEETMEKCVSLQDEAINAIEEWQDIIPEVSDLKTKIGLISDLKSQQTSLIAQIDAMEKQMLASTEQSEGKNQKLQDRLKSKEEELERVRDELRQKRNEINSSSFLTGLSTATTLVPPSGSGEIRVHSASMYPYGLYGTKRCEKCSKTYLPWEKHECGSNIITETEVSD